MRHIKDWAILPVCLLLLVLAASCGKRFNISEYQMKVVSVTPGYWEDGNITSYPSVTVRIDGPDKQLWDVSVSTENGGTPYVESVETGVSCVIVLEGINLSEERREIGLTIQATHVETDEVLDLTRQYKATLEGNFEPPQPPTPQLEQTVFVTGLSRVIGEETSSITLSENGSATLEVMERYSGSLVLAYTLAENEEGPVSCTVSLAQDNPHLSIAQESITPEENRFIIPFTSLKPGTGSFSVTLKGNGDVTVFTVNYVVMSRQYEAAFTPNRFTFGQFDAHGTVNIYGFREGEKCDVVLFWKEAASGKEGSTSYNGVDAKAPLDVLLWKAGEVPEGAQYSFWAQVYLEGESEPVATTEARTAEPFAVEFAWFGPDGQQLADEDKVRSTKSTSTCAFEVRTAAWAPEFINRVTVKDITSDRSYSSSTPVAETEGYYAFEFKHPKRGVHQFSYTLETTEGDFTFETEKTFIDVWTIYPYAERSSLLAQLSGPTSSIKRDINAVFALKGYAVWYYTVAETDANGQHVNTQKICERYIGMKSQEYTISKGTANNGSIRLLSGLFKIGLDMLNDRCARRPFSQTMVTATRWSGSTIQTYTPGTSVTKVEIIITADEAFLNDYCELVTDISKLTPILKEYNILW